MSEPPATSEITDATLRTEPLLGCRLAYWMKGEGAPVLFIQGTGVHGSGWRPQVEELSEHLTCVWFDNRGIGESVPGGEAPISIPQMADDAAAVLDAVGWGSAHIVGHSMGGCVALQLALEYPARVRSLSLLCTSAIGPELVKMTGSTLWRGLRMQFGTKASRRRAFLENLYTPREFASTDLDRAARDLEPIFGHDLGVLPPVSFRQVRALSKWNVVDRLHELREIPTLIVGAEYDLIARPDIVRATAEGIPGATWIQLENAAHGVTATAPELVNSLLSEHLGAPPASGTPRPSIASPDRKSR